MKQEYNNIIMGAPGDPGPRTHNNIIMGTPGALGPGTQQFHDYIIMGPGPRVLRGPHL